MENFTHRDTQKNEEKVAKVKRNCSGIQERKRVDAKARIVGWWTLQVMDTSSIFNWAD